MPWKNKYFVFYDLFGNGLTFYRDIENKLLNINMKLKYLLVLLSFTSIIFAQTPSDILCKVLDIETKYPVSYATIKFEDSQNGVVAGEDGAFRLPADFTMSNKIVIISSIGFETLRLQLSTLKPNIINRILLKPRIESLSEVLITAKKKSINLSPEGIIKEAIKRIPNNYPKSSHSYIAYYRDYQLVNDEYYNLNEGILENFDAGFQTNKYRNHENVTALYSYDSNKDFYLDSLLLKSIYNESKVINRDESAKFSTALQNELEILNVHNPIRNFNVPTFSFVDTFRNNFIDNHSFKLQGVKYMEGIPLYEISFMSKNTEKAKFRAKGRLYISKTNYAIYKIEYKMLENEKFNQTEYGRGNSGIVRKERLGTLYEISVEYKAVNEIMYLNYMAFNNRFVIKEPNPFKVADFEFNPNDKSFYITFNKSVDKSSIERKSRFRLLYKGEKLIVKEIELIDANIIRVDVVDWSAGISKDVAEVVSEDFSYKLNKIKDVSGGTIHKKSKLLGYQFREYFTQEVFENKKPNKDLIFVDKALPLSETKVNEANFNVGTYWINSPLKKTNLPNR